MSVSKQLTLCASDSTSRVRLIIRVGALAVALVVMLHVPDAVADGFIKSLAHPGGNITGFAGLGNIPGKEMAIFKDIVPQLRRPLVLFKPSDPVSSRWLAEVRQAATALKLETV